MRVEKFNGLFRSHIRERESWDIDGRAVAGEETKKNLAEGMDVVLSALNDKVVDLLI